MYQIVAMKINQTVRLVTKYFIQVIFLAEKLS